MTIIQAIVLGVVQGLTEFLPISSSGHLILIPEIFNWNTQSLAFDTVLHLGTAVAVVLYFWKDLLQVIKTPKLLKLLLVGSIPAGIVGFFLENTIETVFRFSTSVVIFLFAGSAIMFVAERFYKKVWDAERISNIDNIPIKKGFFIGIFQSLALFSGVSRSGSTISGGMLLGLKRETAARFSFLLSVPIVIGASLYKVLGSYSELVFDAVLFSGFLSSMVVGVVIIDVFLKFLKKNTLNMFIIYRVVLAGLVILLV